MVASRLVETWGRRGSPLGDPGSAEGGVPVSVRVPVGEIGDWVIRTPNGDVVLVDDGRPTIVCGGAEHSVVGHPALDVEGQAVFTDADLLAAVRRNEAGVAVYLWSPHMPLSVDGYAELAAAAESRGLAVEPVLFAESDHGFARREAARVDMPPSALRSVASSELVLRDAQVHAPAVIVFRGASASPVMPGYRNAAGYGRWLDAVLNPPDPPPGRHP